MHRLSSNFVLGYHGCDSSVADELVQGSGFKSSSNDHDWLGPGIYFWEANPKRGLDFAHELKNLGRGEVDAPAVVGAVIDLGWCLDLTSQAGIEYFVAAHKELEYAHQKIKTPMPENSSDLSRRFLDCAVMQMVHQMRKVSGNPSIDSVRGVFVEGNPVFSGSGVHEKTHIQLAVCNPDCIKGVFKVQPRFLN